MINELKNIFRGNKYNLHCGDVWEVKLCDKQGVVTSHFIAVFKGVYHTRDINSRVTVIQADTYYFSEKDGTGASGRYVPDFKSFEELIKNGNAVKVGAAKISRGEVEAAVMQEIQEWASVPQKRLQVAA